METLRLIFDTTFVAYFMALNLAYTVLLLLGSRQVSEWSGGGRCATSAPSAPRRSRCP